MRRVRAARRASAEREDAGRRRDQADQHAERGRLSGAVRSEQRVELAGLDDQVQIVDRWTLEMLPQPLNLERKGRLVHKHG